MARPEMENTSDYSATIRPQDREPNGKRSNQEDPTRKRATGDAARETQAEQSQDKPANQNDATPNSATPNKKNRKWTVPKDSEIEAKYYVKDMKALNRLRDYIMSHMTTSSDVSCSNPFSIYWDVLNENKSSRLDRLFLYEKGVTYRTRSGRKRGKTAAKEFGMRFWRPDYPWQAAVKNRGDWVEGRSNRFEHEVMWEDEAEPSIEIIDNERARKFLSGVKQDDIEPVFATDVFRVRVKVMCYVNGKKAELEIGLDHNVYRYIGGERNYDDTFVFDERYECELEFKPKKSDPSITVAEADEALAIVYRQLSNIVNFEVATKSKAEVGFDGVKKLWAGEKEMVQRHKNALERIRSGDDLHSGTKHVADKHKRPHPKRRGAMPMPHISS